MDIFLSGHFAIAESSDSCEHDISSSDLVTEFHF